jgi:hypothetical protein
MVTLIEDVARLTGLAGRLAIIERAKDTGTPNHALVERIEIEREILDAATDLLSVLGAFQDEDAATLAVIAERFAMSCPEGKGCPTCAAERDVINPRCPKCGSMWVQGADEYHPTDVCLTCGIHLEYRSGQYHVKEPRP